MNQIALSDDLIEITAEINIWKQQAGQAVFEIGKRLKHVKDNDLVHGQWLPWLVSVDITARTAQKMIQAYEQFANTPSTAHLGTGKIFELLSLPETVDRNEFVESQHKIPSTGEEKTAADMTQKELREVTQKLKEEMRLRELAESRAIHNEKLFNSVKNQPPRIETKTIEVMPEHLKKKMEQLEFDNGNLRHGYKSTKEKLQQYELKNTVEFDSEQAQKQREKLQHEADYSALELRVHITNFMEKAAITAYMKGALAAADPITKKRLNESVGILEEFTNQIKAALNGRILGGIVNE